MSTHLTVALVVCVIGALVHLLPTGNAQPLGRYAFLAGLLAVLWVVR
jgi:hypothetical protein